MIRTCANGHSFEKSSDCPTCPECEREKAAKSGFPKIGAPATRALQNAGVRSVSELVKWTEAELQELHGMGPKAIGILREHLAASGKRFKK